jgi:hypothetical protein
LDQAQYVGPRFAVLPLLGIDMVVSHISLLHSRLDKLNIILARDKEGIAKPGHEDTKRSMTFGEPFPKPNEDVFGILLQAFGCVVAGSLFLGSDCNTFPFGCFLNCCVINFLWLGV